MENEEGRQEENLKKQVKSRYNRTYYLKNRRRLIKAQKARNKANPKLRAQTPRAIAQRRRKEHKRRLEVLERGRAIRHERLGEWKELGWIVAKMNIEAGMSQGRIFEILQGLATRRKIAEWCERGKKLAKLKASRKPRSNG